MKIYEIKKSPAEDSIAGSWIQESDYDVLVDEDAEIRDADTGAVVARLRKAALPAELCKTVWRDLREKLTTDPGNRLMAVGNTTYLANSTNKRALPGASTPSGRVGDAKGQTLGYMDRSVRQPFCRQTAWTAEEVEAWERFVPFAQAVDRVYANTMPKHYAFQREVADKSSQDFVIRDTAFTTVTANKNFQCAVHKDAGDLPGGFGVMTQWRAGDFKGGDIVFPEYRAAIRYGATDVLFANVHLWHGVSKMIGIKKKWERLVCVFYYRDGIQFCGTAAEELKRAAQRKTGDPLKRVHIDRNDPRTSETKP